MTRLTEIISRERQQYLIYICLAITAIALAAILSLAGDRSFERFTGGLNPVLAGLSVVIAGGALITVFLSKGWFAVYKKGQRKGLSLACGLAALLGIIMILVDLKIRFPADMNILFPESLLFYPAIGFFAEILFHVLPVTMLMSAMTSACGNEGRQNIVWVSILIVSLLEPAYQVSWMGNRYPPWAIVYVGLHVFFINLTQLYIFKTYDFISMYAFRLVYYLFWHIGWGYLRLKVLHA